MELLATLAPGRLSPAVGARVVAETGGNPLALAEVAREPSPQAGGFGDVAGAAAVGGSLEQAFGRRVSLLPPETRLLLAVAAAEPAAAQALVWRAARQLGIDPDAAGPLIWAAWPSRPAGGVPASADPLGAYHATPLRQRRRSIRRWRRRATGSGRTGWRGTWGWRRPGPDEAVAARLEQAAGRARDRGGYAATVTFLSRAAELSPGAGQRGRRLLAASDAALIAASRCGPERCWRRRHHGGRPAARAQAMRPDGTTASPLGQAGEAAPVLLEAARASGAHRGGRWPRGAAGGGPRRRVRPLVGQPGGIGRR